MTSPLLINSIIAPTPILLFSINAALNPVAYSITTPPSLMGSIRTLGFRYPSLLAVQMTSTTLA